jgi:single-strand DNA-binding protein
VTLNLVQLIGNLGADPEGRSFPNGGEVVNLRVATSERWKDRDGQQQERTEWHQVAIYGEGLCKVAKSYLRKGSKVYLSGQLRTRKWQDQSGADRYSTEVVLQGPGATLKMLDPKPSGQGGGGDYAGSGSGSGGSGGNYNGGAGRSSGSRPQPAAFDTNLDDDLNDVPF